MLRSLLYCLVGALFVGCASMKPIDDAKIDLDKPKTILTTYRDKPDFMAMTPGKAVALGPFATPLMISKGNEIVRENAIDDPAMLISKAISSDLSSKHDMEVVDGRHHVTGIYSASEVAEKFKGTDWILDVETRNWGFAYMLGGWDSYQVNYGAKLTLIDSRTKSTVAEGYCAKRSRSETGKAPSYDELLANKASRLKAEFELLAGQCVTEFRTKLKI